MSRPSMKEMNKALFFASQHLYEAGRELAMVNEFRPTGMQLLQMSLDLINIVKPEIQKVDDKTMKNILDEILKD